MGYYFRLPARVLLYAISHRQDTTYHGLCYTSSGALAGTRNDSMGSSWRIDPTTYHTMRECCYHEATPRTRNVLSASFRKALANICLLNVPLTRRLATSHRVGDGVSWGGGSSYRLHQRHVANLFGKERGVAQSCRAFAHCAMGRRIDPSWADPLSYFSFQPVLHDWCNKGRGMCYPVCGMVYIK